MTCGFRKCFGQQHEKPFAAGTGKLAASATAHWRVLLRARAIENQVYVLGVNCVGRQQSYTFDGQSCLVNPEGELLCTCGGEKQLVYVTIADDTEQFRQAFPTCRDVKISLYRKLYEDIF